MSFYDAFSVFEELITEEEEIRFGLRSKGGHKGKIDDKVLVWLEQFERIQIRFNDLTVRQGKISSLRVINTQFPKLIDEIKSLVEKASSLLVIHDRNDVDRVHSVRPSQALIGKLAQEISIQIWDDLMDQKIGRICLYGLGGVGKTTIMKNINNQLTNTDMFDKVIWVALAKDVAIENVQDDIADQLNIKLPTPWDLRRRATILNQHLKTLKRYLFILDNVCSEHIWFGRMGIPEPGQNGCKVVLTTRSRALCIHMGVDRWVQLTPLSEDEAWELFVAKSGDHVLDPEINSFAKRLANDCRGLPIALITVAHAMREEVNPTAWRLLARMDMQNEVQGDAMHLLKFGYDRLKNDRIQKCFLYCALFPEGYKFDPDELIGYWMAEGFIQSESDITRTYDKGLEILRELKSANMLETSVEGGNEQLQMHDLLRDLALAIVTREMRWLMRAGQRLTDFPPPSECKGAEKISFVRNHVTRLGHLVNSNLSTLLLKDNPLWLITLDFKFMPNLQVIDLSFTGIKHLPLSLCKLAKLRALFLQYCTSLTNIPSVEELEQLQVLKLCGTLITELPHGMKDLVSLKSLDLSDTVRLKNIETGVISSLFNLEELQMQGSGLCTMQTKTVRKCLKEIRCLKKLAILGLSAVGFKDHLDTILFLQGHSLKRFSINVYGSASDYIGDV